MPTSKRCLTLSVGSVPNALGALQTKVIEPGARPCSFFDCSGLPKELEVTCSICVYDFAADDGQVKCDHDTCETAVRLKKNVETYKTWLRLIEAEAARQS